MGTSSKAGILLKVFCLGDSFLWQKMPKRWQRLQGIFLISEWTSCELIFLLVCQVFMISKVHMGVSKNYGTPKSSMLIGFSIIKFIHFGGPPLFLETPIYKNDSFLFEHPPSVDMWSQRLQLSLQRWLPLVPRSVRPSTSDEEQVVRLVFIAVFVT